MKKVVLPLCCLLNNVFILKILSTSSSIELPQTTQSWVNDMKYALSMLLTYTLKEKHCPNYHQQNLLIMRNQPTYGRWILPTLLFEHFSCYCHLREGTHGQHEPGDLGYSCLCRRIPNKVLGISRPQVIPLRDEDSPYSTNLHCPCNPRNPSSKKKRCKFEVQRPYHSIKHKWFSKHTGARDDYFTTQELLFPFALKYEC